jgi:hypothetical protein
VAAHQPGHPSLHRSTAADVTRRRRADTHPLSLANRTWRAERIRGELLKLHLQVAKGTIQRYLRDARPPRRSGQTWATFLANHGKDIWAADFLPITDLLLRPLYV